MFKTIFDLLRALFRTRQKTSHESPPSEDTEFSPESESEFPPGRWYYADSSGNTVGPFTLSNLWRLALAGIISDATFVIEESGNEWKTYSSIFSIIGPRNRPGTTYQPRDEHLGRKPQRRFVLYVLIGVVLVTIFGGLAAAIAFLPFASSKSTSPAATTSSAAQSTPSLPSDQDTTSTDHTLRLKPIDSSQQDIYLGESFEAGYDTYEILQCLRRYSLGVDSEQIQASPGSIFVVIEYTLLNESAETQVVMSDDFILMDSKHRVFHPSSRALTALLTESPYKDFLLSKFLKPGLIKQSVAAYEVPLNTAYGTMILAVPVSGTDHGKAVLLESRP